MRKIQFSTFAAILVALVAITGCSLKMHEPPVIDNPVADRTASGGDAFMAGFSKRAVTPKFPVFIAGFGPMRLNVAVHDDIYVRTLVVKKGDEKFAMVAVDVIGIQREDVLAMKAGVEGFRADQILIASTHTHGGPDTLGLWGIPFVLSGRSDRYMKRIGRAVAETIEEADKGAVPVKVSATVFDLEPSIMVNFNEGEPEDEKAGLMAFESMDGKRVATLINISGHPEAMWSDNHILTADYPGRVCELTEKEYGGGAVFFSADLGAMMSPTRPGPDEEHDFKRMERISRNIFAEVKRANGLLEELPDPGLTHRMSDILFTAENEFYQKLVRYGILDRKIYEDLMVLTSVHVIEIGDAQFVTFPGEAYPKIGLSMREKMNPHAFLIGLGDDELGYILYPKDYGTELYDYESSMCPGPELSVMMEEELTRLLEMD